MKNPPKFTANINVINGQRILRIWDCSDAYPDAMSVTNGAEYVLNQLEQENGPLPDLIIYKDSLGQWDRMNRLPCGSVEFAPIVPGVKSITDDNEAAQLATGGKL
ncbi:hypothetical protein B7L51_003965 [Pectobacterium brasiliense]|uniref:hypothetical protein n=1 Tax=Pectobacterium brasiliense TaxID=180957 RepID=UPI000B97C208|nr:hypothetical protein [Pectobacterium carotovorum]OYN52663.1 hypothetical protein B7L51_03925 [Pectobacterium carotovorum]OYN52678.1 hypothetical protein B7L51_04010 [Pectobacterium carotovorum]